MFQTNYLFHFNTYFGSTLLKWFEGLTSGLICIILSTDLFQYIVFPIKTDEQLDSKNVT